MRRLIGRSVGRKLALAVSAILAIFSLFFVAALLRVSQSYLQEINETWLAILSDSVAGSIETVMEQGHGPGFRKVVQDAADHEEIAAIRVLTLEGRIAFSSDEKEVGNSIEETLAAVLPVRDEKSLPAHAPLPPPEPTPPAAGERDDFGNAPEPHTLSSLLDGRIRTAEDGVQIRSIPGRIDSLRPIMNGKECQNCHARTESQLGVLHIAVSTKKTDVEVASFQKMLAWLTLLPVFFVVATILAATRYVVAKPLRTLTRTIRKAEQGDFLHRAHVPGRDEIAVLANDFNTMLGRITTLTAMNMERERELVAAQEEMRTRAALEEKASIIESTNRELSDRNRELDILFKLAQKISSSLEIQELFDSLTQVVGNTLGFRRFVVFLLDSKTGILEAKATHGFGPEDGILGMTFKVGEGIAGVCARDGEQILIPDTRKDSRYLHYKGRHSIDGALLCLPLKWKEGVLGVLSFERTILEGFSEPEIQFLIAIANAASIAIENAQLYERTRDLSATDELTKLANRRAFYERLEHELRRADRFHRSVSVLMIDIDFFKKFNDKHGHLDGDEILRRASDVFRENVREVDLVARFGGEEFVVILPDADKVEAGAVAEKLRSRLSKTRFPKAETQPGGKLTISVGAASYPSDASDQGTLIDSADFALYRAKETGRNRVVIFDEALRAELAKLRVSH